MAVMVIMVKTVAAREEEEEGGEEDVRVAERGRMQRVAGRGATAGEEIAVAITDLVDPGRGRGTIMANDRGMRCQYIYYIFMM